MTHEEDRAAQREANRQERIKLGLHPKMGSESLAETRRILMTWTKADLVNFQIREESESIFAHERAVAAERALRDDRMESVTAEKPKHPRPDHDGQRSFAWKLWQQPRKGELFGAEAVFAAGWDAHKANDKGEQQ